MPPWLTPWFPGDYHHQLVMGTLAAYVLVLRLPGKTLLNDMICSHRSHPDHRVMLLMFRSPGSAGSWLKQTWFSDRLAPRNPVLLFITPFVYRG
jgi:hypothetical protein